MRDIWFECTYNRRRRRAREGPSHGWRGLWWKKGKRSTWWAYIILDLGFFKSSSCFESIENTKPTGERVVKKKMKATIFLFCFMRLQIGRCDHCDDDSEWDQTKPVQLSCSRQIPDPFHNAQKTSDPVLTGIQVWLLSGICLKFISKILKLSIQFGTKSTKSSRTDDA